MTNFLAAPVDTLSPKQEDRLRRIAAAAHMLRMDVVTAMRMGETVAAYRLRLTNEHEEAARALELADQNRGYLRQFVDVPQQMVETRQGAYEVAKAVLDSIDAKLQEATAEMTTFNQRASELQGAIVATTDLIGRVLRHAELDESDLGIKFRELPSFVHNLVSRVAV